MSPPPVRDEEHVLILRSIAHTLKELKQQKEANVTFRKEVLGRLDSIDQHLRALLSTPEREARRILTEHDRVRLSLFIFIIFILH